jgi:YfiH family protein
LLINPKYQVVKYWPLQKSPKIKYLTYGVIPFIYPTHVEVDVLFLILLMFFVFKMKNLTETFPLYQFQNLSRFSKLLHFVTTRFGGVSIAPYNSLNLGLHTADNTAHVLQNRALLANKIGIENDKILYASQVHSGDVKIIDDEAVADGILKTNPETDAMVTHIPGICLMVMVADCVPVLFFDPVKNVIAVIHAGWRGTVQKIVSNTIAAMKTNYGSNPSNLIAAIGPSIGPCCYEVGEEVKNCVADSFGTIQGYMIKQKESEKYNFDLWHSNHKQLIDNGLRTENIETAGICTKCNSDTYYSSRASGGITGRFAAGLCILKT